MHKKLGVEETHSASELKRCSEITAFELYLSQNSWPNKILPGNLISITDQSRTDLAKARDEGPLATGFSPLLRLL